MRLKPRSRKTATRADRDRGTAAQRGYGRKWRDYDNQTGAADRFLRRNPLCVTCEQREPLSPQPATVVDHIVPHRGNKTLFWDRDNWQALCKSCHDKKTWRENH